MQRVNNCFAAALPDHMSTWPTTEKFHRGRLTTASNHHLLTVCYSPQVSFYWLKSPQEAVTQPPPHVMEEDEAVQEGNRIRTKSSGSPSRHKESSEEKVFGVVWGVKTNRLSLWVSVALLLWMAAPFSPNNSRACLQEQRSPRFRSHVCCRRNQPRCREMKARAASNVSDQKKKKKKKRGSRNHSRPNFIDKDPLLCCTVNIFLSCTHTHTHLLFKLHTHALIRQCLFPLAEPSDTFT